MSILWSTFFLPEKRTYYDIERLRKSAQTIDQEQLKGMLVKKTAGVHAPAKQRRKSRCEKAVVRNRKSGKESGSQKTPLKKGLS